MIEIKTFLRDSRGFGPKRFIQIREYWDGDKKILEVNEYSQFVTTSGKFKLAFEATLEELQEAEKLGMFLV